jgi:hypothetical protein
LAGAALVLAGLLASWAVPWWGEALQGPIQRAAFSAGRAQSERVTSGLPPAGVVQYRIHQPSFSVALGQEAPRRDPLPGEMALTRRDRMTGADSLRPVLFEERGVVLLGPAP